MKQAQLITIAVLSVLFATPLSYAAGDEPDDAQNVQQQAGASDDKTSTGEGRSDSMPSDRVDDATITENVKKALGQEPQIANQNVQIDTQDGVVTVSGQVNDERYKGKIIQVIQGVYGVKSVRNNITLGTPDPGNPS